MDEWVPIVTFILGSLFGLLGEHFRDRRLSKREREHRQAERDAVHEQARKAFQRENLLVLQQTLYDFGRAHFQMNLHENVQHRLKGEAWGKVVFPDELAQKELEAGRSLQIYQVRALDDDLRALVDDVALRGTALSSALNAQMAEDILNDLTVALEKTNNRIGYLLREVYT